ncbi:MAG: ABC transporter ATP-binding protein [Thermacetogeniaceae bacterium]
MLKKPGRQGVDEAMDAVVVCDLTFRYWPDGPDVLNRISFQATPGEIVAVTGLSGCGKSTLCLCLNGIIPHSRGGEMSGLVLVNGKDTREHRVASLALEVGLVFQDPDTQLFSPTVEDEIAFAPENLCLPPGRIRERVNQAVTLLGIEAFRNANPNRLSGGEQHLVALAAVLALDPPVLVLDEVISGLDTGGRKMVADTLETLRCQGKTIIVVEHDLESVAFADRMLVLDNGAISRLDRAEAILADRDWLATRRLIF